MRRETGQGGKLIAPILGTLRILFSPTDNPCLISLSVDLQTAGVPLWETTLPELSLYLQLYGIRLRAQMAILKGFQEPMLMLF